MEPFASPNPPATVEDYPEWAIRNGQLARAWFETGNVVEAIKVLERIIAIPRELRRPQIRNQDGWLAHSNLLAQCYRQVGRIAEAEPIEAQLRVLLRFADADHPIRKRLDGVRPAR